MALVEISDPAKFEQELTQAEASALFDAKVYMTWTPLQRALFQLQQPFMVMPWRDFQDAVEKALGQIVSTIAFENPQSLIDAIKEKHGLDQP